jgi:L-histidine Nalpha-methyltransferase
MIVKQRNLVATAATAGERARTQVDPADQAASTGAARDLAEVRDGLNAPRKHLPCRLLYDARGAELFEQICTLEEYYPTRNELALLAAHLPTIASAVGVGARVIEPGSGAGKKTRMLLRALERPAAYVPIDISAEQLVENARALRQEFPALEVHPVHADYMSALEVPAAPADANTLVFFPGSTIGNFEPEAARRFLERLGVMAGGRGMLLLGADSNNDSESLLRAYDDSQGVTAEFNLNLLRHLNRSYGARFDLDTFAHRAVWDPTHSRVEMHLVSRRRQLVEAAGETFAFERGEAIVTEHCYKHSAIALTGLLERAGWRIQQVFTGSMGRMRLWLAERSAAPRP